MKLSQFLPHEYNSVFERYDIIIIRIKVYIEFLYKGFAFERVLYYQDRLKQSTVIDT